MSEPLAHLYDLVLRALEQQERRVDTRALEARGALEDETAFHTTMVTLLDRHRQVGRDAADRLDARFAVLVWESSWGISR